MSMQKNIEWLRHRTEQYRSITNNMCEAIEDFDEVYKLGQALQIFSYMGVKSVKAFGDSLLVVQQVADVFQYFDGSLNDYLDKCLEIITLFDDFTMQHVSRDENTLVNDLTQQASGFRSNRGKFGFLKKIGCSGLPNRTVRFLANAQCNSLFY
jgi:hypothetical protein